MTKYSRTLIPLCNCLRGVLPEDPDWMGLIGLANQTLTTTSLMPFVEQYADRIPEDVSRYVREMFSRNQMRNDLLAAQLEESIEALNQAGVTPILLKGAAMLAMSPQTKCATKLMSDLDIAVSPNETKMTADALSRIGYQLHAEATPGGQKWYTDWKRSQDVGMIDLHGGLPGPAFFYHEIGDIRRHCELVSVGSGSAYVPSAAFHALIVTIHDQFQDYDYWLGNIDLRHLLYLRDLIQSPNGFDWDLLRALTPDALARNALETQLISLFFLLDVDIPDDFRARWIPRLQHLRRVYQAKLPLLRTAFLPLAVLDYSNYRRGIAANQKHIDAGRTDKAAPMKATSRLVTLSRRQHFGKV